MWVVTVGLDSGWKVNGTIKEDLVSLLLTTPASSTIKCNRVLCESRMCSTCLINFIAMLPGYCLYMTLRSKVALFSTFVTGLIRRKTFPSFIRMFGATKLGFSFLGLLRPLRFALLLSPFSFLFSFAEWCFPAAWTVFGHSVSALCESWIAHWRKELPYTWLTLA